MAGFTGTFQDVINIDGVPRFHLSLKAELSGGHYFGESAELKSELDAEAQEIFNILAAESQTLLEDLAVIFSRDSNEDGSNGPASAPLSDDCGPQCECGR